MRNNKGFGKFEVLTVIVLLMIVGSFLLYGVIKQSPEEGLKTMKNDAIKFSNAVATNNDTFHNTNFVYLGEVLDEKLISEIKNPVGKGNCSQSESFVEMINGTAVTTLRCGNYLIDKATFAGGEKMKVYQVSDWSEKKSSSSNDQKKLYNCLVKGKEKYPEYYDELYFVYLINQDYDTGHFFADTVDPSDCKVVSKTFYREKTEYQG